MVVSNDEREQTLNQLLAEMDGFDVTQGIVVLAATNRPEILDPALLRPGRFDRQVTIPLPTLPERAAILAVHCRDKKLGPDVDLNVVARGTPGFSGADLANLANEAAIVAVRDNREVLTAEDFSDARDRILLGRREGSNVLLPDEKHAVAIHESGHALVAALSEHADPVAKITILPAGQTLGVTEQLPLDERHLYQEDYLTDSLAVRLGGRAAELVKFGQGSTGPPTTWPAPPTWRPRWSASSACRRSSDPSGTPRAARCSWAAEAGRGCPPAVRRGHPGHHRRRGVPAAPRGRADRGRALGSHGPSSISSSTSCWSTRRSTGGGVPDRRQTGARAPAGGDGDRAAGRGRGGRGAPGRTCARPGRPATRPGPDEAAGPVGPAHRMATGLGAGSWAEF